MLWSFVHYKVLLVLQGEWLASIKWMLLFKVSKPGLPRSWYMSFQNTTLCGILRQTLVVPVPARLVYKCPATMESDRWNVLLTCLISMMLWLVYVSPPTSLLCRNWRYKWREESIGLKALCHKEKAPGIKNELSEEGDCFFSFFSYPGSGVNWARDK